MSNFFKSLILYILLLFIVAACPVKRNSDKITLKKCGRVVLEISDTVLFNIPKYVQFNISEGTGLLSLYYDKKIYFFNSKDGEYLFLINLESVQINSFQGHFVHNLDSIFLLTKDPTKIYLFDKNLESTFILDLSFPAFFKVLDKISNKINRSGVFEKYTSNYAKLYYNNHSVYTMNHNYNALNKYDPQSKSLKYYYDSGYYHLKGKSASHIIKFDSTGIKYYNCETGIYPQTYTEKNSYFVHGTPVSRALNGDILVYSFNMDHHLYLYDHSGFLRKVVARSSYLDNLFVTDPNKYFQNPMYKKEHFISEGYYAGILYDKYRNLYYRIVVHEQPYQKDQYTINRWGDNPWSIMILDEDFSILDEIVFDPRDYDFNNVVVTNKGLLIHEYYENDYRKSHEFDLFKVNLN